VIFINAPIMVDPWPPALDVFPEFGTARQIRVMLTSPPLLNEILLTIERLKSHAKDTMVL